MKMLYDDPKFNAISNFMNWVEDQYVELMDDFDISTFILDLVGVTTLKDGSMQKVLIDPAIYPDWKKIELHYSNYNAFEQFIQFINYYQDNFDFNMESLINVVVTPRAQKKFQELLGNQNW